MTLEWPDNCRLTLEARREIEADHARRQPATAAGDWREQRIARLERRLAALERALGPDGQLVDTLGELVAKLRKETKQAVADEFVRRQPMTHRGIWSPDVEYQPGHVTTHAGAAWAARIESRGSRPGTDGVWRLIAKGSGGS